MCIKTVLAIKANAPFTGPHGSRSAPKGHRMNKMDNSIQIQAMSMVIENLDVFVVENPVEFNIMAKNWRVFVKDKTILGVSEWSSHKIVWWNDSEDSTHITELSTIFRR